MVLNTIKRALALSISTATNSEITPEVCFALLEQPKKTEHGDISFPCFQLAKARSLPPPVCAANLKESIQLPDFYQ